MIKVNISSKLGEMADSLAEFDKSAILRSVALTTMASMRKRVHVEGEASDGSQIGRYSKGYLVTRSGQFQNNRKKRGKGFVKAGNQKGAYTKGNKAGQKRMYYNRGTDHKVILSLSRTMENDMTVMGIPGGFGIGYNNPENLNKAIWNEQRYDKKVWSLSEAESEMVDNIVSEYIDEILQ